MNRSIITTSASVLCAVALGFVLFNNRTMHGVGVQMTMTVTSNDFHDGQQLGIDQTCDGSNASPQLSWGNVPGRAKSFSIICEDPDAPSKVWVHWVIFNIPEQQTMLERGVSDATIRSMGACQGMNDFNKLGYGGACPPRGHGTHHYVFKIYALDVMLDLQEGASKADVEQAMQGHILAIGQIIGLYARS